MTISEIREEFWPSILDVQADAYHEIEAESLDVLRSKWLASPDTCLVSLSDSNNIEAYLLAHPWQGGAPPKLFTELSLMTQGNELYLHDLAVSNNCQGKDSGRKLVSFLINNAKAVGVKKISLVAVQGSHNFVAGQGFTQVDDVKISKSYGNNAVLMSKQ